MYGDGRSLQAYLDDSDYGEGWREYVDFYFPAQLNISYEELGLGRTYSFGKDTWWLQDNIEQALAKSSFEKMQGLEEKGFGSYQTGDRRIKFCRAGTSGQWRKWTRGMQEELISKNAIQLKKLGYYERIP